MVAYAIAFGDDHCGPRSVPRLCLAATSHSESHPATRDGSADFRRLFAMLPNLKVFILYQQALSGGAMVLGHLGFSVRVAEKGESSR